MSQTPVPITGGTGTSSIAAELVGATSWQQVEIYGGGGASVLSINPDGSIKASIIGVATVSFSGSPSISGAVTVVGNPSISGTVNIAGNPSISGTVNIAGTPSISGTVLLGAAPSIYGNISGSVVGFQGGTWSTSVVTFIAPKASWISGVTSVITGTAQTSVLLAAGGSIKNYVTHIMCSNGAAVGTFVDIKDGGGNVLYSGFAAASGGGFSSHIYPPIVGSANKSVDAQPRVQASIIVAMTGYTDL